ncbi:hypothetical protein DFH07DRAFT_775635 [Mycena maculata]|uniref:Uncharacterized protein n=1 Tax=Mycena maculata TaxID=230809 RepID=A0AAD7IU10_9AGAR|nr:hypothetical protein DFH07DRAFT_775635 [Mycena maculata]
MSGNYEWKKGVLGLALGKDVHLMGSDNTKTVKAWIFAHVRNFEEDPVGMWERLREIHHSSGLGGVAAMWKKFYGLPICPWQLLISVHHRPPFSSIPAAFHQGQFSCLWPSGTPPEFCLFLAHWHFESSRTLYHRTVAITCASFPLRPGLPEPHSRTFCIAPHDFARTPTCALAPSGAYFCTTFASIIVVLWYRSGPLFHLSASILATLYSSTLSEQYMNIFIRPIFGLGGLPVCELYRKMMKTAAILVMGQCLYGSSQKWTCLEVLNRSLLAAGIMYFRSCALAVVKPWKTCKGTSINILEHCWIEGN